MEENEEVRFVVPYEICKSLDGCSKDVLFTDSSTDL